jgi:hypothetical protein
MKRNRIHQQMIVVRQHPHKKLPLKRSNICLKILPENINSIAFFFLKRSTSSSIIKGVCDDSLLHGNCQNTNCDLLHLTEPIQLTDGHFHDRLLTENWSCVIEPLQNIEQFIGITNVHKSSMWDNTISIIPESLKSKVYYS